VKKHASLVGLVCGFILAGLVVLNMVGREQCEDHLDVASAALDECRLHNLPMPEPDVCTVATRANGTALPLIAAELKAIKASCGRLDSFLTVDTYSGFSPEHPACAMVKEAGLVLPTECRDWEVKRMHGSWK
jgi:hypothetical protein